MLMYPEKHEAEVNAWLEIIIHDPLANSSQDEATQYAGVIETIRLQAPQNLIENNVANYESTDFKLTSAIADIDSFGDFVDSFGGFGKMALGMISGGGEAEVNRLLGSVTNPRSEQFFKGPGFRTFTFHWEFAPRNEGDANALQDIYRTIRKHSYPELKQDSNNMLYTMPAEFELNYLVDTGSGLEDADPKFGKTVVTNISMNYTGAGINVHTTSQVAPFINMDITFAERTLLNRDSEPIK